MNSDSVLKPSVRTSARPLVAVTEAKIIELGYRLDPLSDALSELSDAIGSWSDARETKDGVGDARADLEAAIDNLAEPLSAVLSMLTPAAFERLTGIVYVLRRA